MAKIFISYRRRYNGHIADFLSEKLCERFGEDSVFYDIDDIPFGVDFREYIGNAVGQCDVLLAIIGENWVSAADEQGKKKLDNPGDYVRIEIESALNRKISVIPLLVEQAMMPPPADLPESLREMVYLNAAEIRSGSDYRQHLERLINGLEALLKPKPETIKKETIQKPGATPKKKEKAPPKEMKAPAEVLAEKQVKPDPELSEEGREALSVIVKALDGFNNAALFLAGEIPDKKLNEAIDSYAPGVRRQDILLLYNSRHKRNASQGLLLTADAVYWSAFVRSETELFSKIEDVEDQAFYTQTSTTREFSKCEITFGGPSMRGKSIRDRAIPIGAGGQRMAKVLADVIRDLGLWARGRAIEDPKPAGSGSVIISNDRSCQLSVPEGWVKRVNLDSHAQLQAENRSEWLNVFILREPKSGLSPLPTLKEYVDLFYNDARKLVTDPQLSQYTVSYIDGLTALWFDVSGTYLGRNEKFVLTCIETPENFYRITGRTFAKDNESKLKDVINSFKELEP